MAAGPLGERPVQWGEAMKMPLKLAQVSLALVAFLLSSTPSIAFAHGQREMIEVVTFALALLLALTQWAIMRACRPGLPRWKFITLRSFVGLLCVANANLIVSHLHNVYAVQWGADLEMVIVPICIHAAAVVYGIWWLLRPRKRR
jgi:hypothetical protein